MQRRDGLRWRLVDTHGNGRPMPAGTLEALLSAAGVCLAFAFLAGGAEEHKAVLSVPVLKQVRPHPLAGERRLAAHDRFWEQFLRDGRSGHTGPPVELLVARIPDAYYFGRVSVGQPPQAFMVLVDLSSANLWVPGRFCQRGNGMMRYRQFDGSISHTYQTSRSGARLSYGDGACAGYFSRDTLRVGNATLPDGVFLEAMAATELFANSEVDGILGLALPQAALSEGVETPLEALARVYGGALTEKVFYFQIPDDPEEQPGQLVFGRVPHERYPRGMNWVDVAHESAGVSRWAVHFDRVSIGPSTMLGRAGIVDASASCIVMPPADALTFFRQSRETSALDSRCTAQPVISLTIGGQHYRLRGEDYGTQHLGACEMCVHADPDTSVWVLGEVFLRKFPPVYKFSSPRPQVGFPTGEIPQLWGCTFLVMLALVAFAVGWRALAWHRSGRRLPDRPLFGGPERPVRVDTSRLGADAANHSAPMEVPLTPRSVATDAEEFTGMGQPATAAGQGPLAMG